MAKQFCGPSTVFIFCSLCNLLILCVVKKKRQFRHLTQLYCIWAHISDLPSSVFTFKFLAPGLSNRATPDSSVLSTAFHILFLDSLHTVLLPLGSVDIRASYWQDGPGPLSALHRNHWPSGTHKPFFHEVVILMSCSGATVLSLWPVKYAIVRDYFHWSAPLRTRETVDTCLLKIIYIRVLCWRKTEIYV